MHAIHEKIQSELSGAIDAFYFCPHLPCDGCQCRKPNTGMIESAMADFDIDLEASWMVGDKKIDIETSIAANMKNALVLTGYGTQHKVLLQNKPDILALDLEEAVNVIIGRKV